MKHRVFCNYDQIIYSVFWKLRKKCNLEAIQYRIVINTDEPKFQPKWRKHILRRNLTSQGIPKPVALPYYQKPKIENSIDVNHLKLACEVGTI